MRRADALRPNPFSSTFLCLVCLLACLPVSGSGATDDAALPAPRFPDVIALWRSGQSSRALNLLDGVEQALKGGEVPVDVLVLKATLLKELKRPEESEAYWNGAVLREPALREAALQELYALRLARGDLDGAESCLDDLSAVADRYLVLAQRQDEHGDAAHAVRLYQRALKAGLRGRAADRARLELASRAGERGAIPEALELLNTLRRTSSDTRNIRLAIFYGTILGLPSGDLPAPLSEKEYATAARRLRDQAEYKRAIAELEEWRAAYPDSTRADEIEAEIIETLFRLRANAEALSRCETFADAYPDSPLLAAVRFNELMLQQRYGNTEAMLELGNRFWKDRAWGNIGQQRNAAQVVAAHLVSHGRVADGLDLYRDIYRSGPGDDTARDILWRVGIAALADGQYDRAASNFRVLLRKNPDGDSLPSSLFWLAVTELKRGNPEEAGRMLLRLSDEFTFTYYGLRAAEALQGAEMTLGPEFFARLRAGQPEERAPFPSAGLSAKVTGSDQYRVAAVFARAGMLNDAAAAADTLLKRFRGDAGVALLTARAHFSAGDYRAAVRITTDNFKPYLQCPTSGAPDDLLLLVYPRPWWEEVKAAAERNRIDPNLMMSLMRRESRFDRFARSWVGAIGLFQIMPYTARELSPRLGLGTIRSDDLYKPHVNAAIAASLAADLLKRFDQQLAPAVASYNAGEDRVTAWWQSTPASPIAEALFVDTIPYRETRFFVREVLTNYHMYQVLYPPPQTSRGVTGKDLGADPGR